MQIQGPFGPPGQMISWVPMFRSSREVFGYHVEPCSPYTYFSDTVCQMGCVPQADYKRVPVRVLFSDYAYHAGMKFASPARDVQRLEEQLEEQLEEESEEEDIGILSCSPDSMADEVLSDPLECRIRELFRQIGHCLPGGRLPGSTSRGRAFSRAYQKEYRQEINRSGNVVVAKHLAKLAGSAASDKERERLEREASVGSIEYLKDELASACFRAVHRQYQIARRAELKRSGDPQKARAAARLASNATKLRLERISGVDNSHKSIHFTDADILNASYMAAYRKARNRQLSCSGDRIKAKKAGRVAGTRARAQTEQALRCNPAEVRKAFKVTPSLAAGKEYRAAYALAKDKAFRIEMALSGDPVRAESVACEAGKKAGREARKSYMQSFRPRVRSRREKAVQVAVSCVKI